MAVDVSMKRISHAGMNELKKRVDLHKAIDGARVKVGFPKGGATYEDGLTVAQVAVINEFGSELAGIPKRPFLRPAASKNKAKYKRKGAEYIKAIFAEKIDWKRALGLLGMEASDDIVSQINATTEPPNSDATIAAKNGKSHPLIDTGKMRQSVSYTINDGPIKRGSKGGDE